MVSLVLAGIAILAAMPASGAEEALTVSVKGADRAWVVMIPFRVGSDTAVASVAPAAPVTMSVPPGEPVLLCAGARERATACEQVLPDDDRRRGYSLDAGRRVEGRCFVGRTPARGAAISVRVGGVEMRRHAPMPLALREGKWVTSIVADDQGRFTIEHLAPRSYVFEVTTADGRVEETAAIEVPPVRTPPQGGTPEPRTFQLPEIRLAGGGEVTVEVRDDAGTPIPGAAVSVSQDGVRDAVPRRIEVKANDDGVAVVGGVDFARPARVSCAADGFTRHGELFEAIPALATCTLRRLSTLRGTVVDSREAAVAGATIELAGTTRRATANGEGLFTFDDLEPGEYLVRVSSATTGVAGRDVSIPAGARVDAGRIVVEDGVKLRARVIDAATRQPVGGAAIDVIDPSTAASSESDAEGLVEIVGDPRTPTRIRVRAVGYAPAVAALVPAGAEILMVELVRPGALEIRAWDSRTGDPCRACTIAILGPDFSGYQLTDTNGRARQGGLAPGRYQVAREELSATSREVRISGGGDSELVTVRSGEIAVVQLGSESRSIAISVGVPLGPEWALHAITSSQSVRATPSASGVYVFRRRAGEAYELQLQSPYVGVTIGSVPAAWSNELLSVALGTGRVDVRLTAGNAAAAGVLVKLVAEDGRQAAWAHTGPDGQVSVPYLRAGAYAAVVGGTTVGVAHVTAGRTHRIDAAIGIQ